MANDDGSWAPSALVRFGSLVFIVSFGGGLERIQAPTRSGDIDAVTDMLRGPHLFHQGDIPAPHHRSGFDTPRLERQLQAALGPHSTHDDLRCTAYTLANVAAQLAGGDPISPDVLTDHAMTAFLPGRGNTAQHVSHHVASSVTTHPGGIELVGMLGFVSESDDDLLVTDSSLGSNLDPSCRSHHPSR